MIIDQISFVSHNLTPNQPTPLNYPYMQVVCPLPHINYVETCSIPTSTNYLVGDVLNHVPGALEPNISIRSLDMYPFQRVGLPSDENLLESMASYGP